MKCFKKLLLFSVVLFSTQIALAQTDCVPCQKLLENGLYKTFKFAKGGTFEQDFKTYLVSENFKADFKDHRWGGDLNVLIPQEAAPPIPVGLKANASDQDISIFQQKIATYTSIKISSSFYDFALSSIPDIELAKEYNNCVLGLCKFGFKVDTDIGESLITYKIGYRKEFEVDPMPTIKNFVVIDGEVLTGILQPGKPLGNDTTIIVRRQPDKDSVFILDTDKGGISRRIPGSSAGFNKDLPLGTIIASYLTFEQFNGVTSNNINCPNNLWLARCSKWSPADGRVVTGSKLADFPLPLSGFIPDLRGVFLRGLNEFDTSGSAPPQNEARNDSEKNRRLGSYQADAFKEHHHFFAEGQNQTMRGGDSTSYGRNGNAGQRDTGDQGGIETRPKNIAIYYYIRIN